MEKLKLQLASFLTAPALHLTRNNISRIKTVFNMWDGLAYTPHEVRTIIRNCNTHSELQQAWFLILTTDMHNYSPILMHAFERAIYRQRMKIKPASAV